MNYRHYPKATQSHQEKQLLIPSTQEINAKVINISTQKMKKKFMPLQVQTGLFLYPRQVEPEVTE
jgi:hypothetical protein